MLETFSLGIFIPLCYLIFIQSFGVNSIRTRLKIGILEFPKSLDNHLLSSRVFEKSLEKPNAFGTTFFFHKV